MTRFDFIVDVATDQNQARTNKESVAFHYFNPNGLVTRKRINDQAISDLIDQGILKGGCLFAYGSFHDTWVDNMINLYKQKRVNSIRLKTAVELLLKDCIDQEKIITEAKGA